MTSNLLQVWSSVDPRELPINRRFKNSQTVHPRAKKAQRQLADDIKAAIPKKYQPCMEECAVIVRFYYPDRRTDVDAAIKRTLDALQMALKESGFQWHDGKIYKLSVFRDKTNPSHPNPGIGISML